MAATLVMDNFRHHQRLDQDPDEVLVKLRRERALLWRPSRPKRMTRGRFKESPLGSGSVQCDADLVAWSEYMTGIRSRIGSELLLTPAAGVALFDAEDRVFLARHGHDGRWGTPGGGVEPGETPSEAAARELTEETGLRATDLHLIDAFGGKDFEVVYPGGIRTAYVVILYGATSWTGDVALQDDELTACGWFTKHEVERLDVPSDMHQLLPAAFAWMELRTDRR